MVATGRKISPNDLHVPPNSSSFPLFSDLVFFANVQMQSARMKLQTADVSIQFVDIIHPSSHAFAAPGFFAAESVTIV
jgi:hypothetical protein